MPVYKYKSYQEARDAILVRKPDENYYKMLSGFYKTFGNFFSLNFPRGVYKFRTIEDAQRQKEDWILKRQLH